MSATEGAVGERDAGAPRRRRRVAVVVAEVTRGASEEALERPAEEFLEAMPWQGPSPDPDGLDAMTFLTWL